MFNSLFPFYSIQESGSLGSAILAQDGSPTSIKPLGNALKDMPIS